MEEKGGKSRSVEELSPCSLKFTCPCSVCNSVSAFWFAVSAGASCSFRFLSCMCILLMAAKYLSDGLLQSFHQGWHWISAVSPLWACMIHSTSVDGSHPHHCGLSIPFRSHCSPCVWPFTQKVTSHQAFPLEMRLVVAFLESSKLAAWETDIKGPKGVTVHSI
jgi:hypothetical protein